MEKEAYRYVDLAVVEAYGTHDRYVVQCPAWEATVGGLVEFEADARMSVGQIIGKMTVEQNDGQWSFISQAAEIIPCVRVWARVGEQNENS